MEVEGVSNRSLDECSTSHREEPSISKHRNSMAESRQELERALLGTLQELDNLNAIVEDYQEDSQPALMKKMYAVCGNEDDQARQAFSESQQDCRYSRIPVVNDLLHS